MQLAQTLAGNVFQIGYVVPDIHASVRFFKEKLGVPNFLVKEDIQGQEQTYRGKPGDFRHSIAFGYAGDVQIELIQTALRREHLFRISRTKSEGRRPSPRHPVRRLQCRRCRHDRSRL